MRVDGKEIELARRTSGDYVGELSIIIREPRNATLIACGDVRALSIDQKTFEGLIRERPGSEPVHHPDAFQASEGNDR